jgi:hypothetical protein
MMDMRHAFPPLSLPGSSRQSTITDGAFIAPAVIMDARNECGHDKELGAFP